MENLTPYIFKREAGRCVFVPAPAFAGLTIGMFGAGSLFMLYVSSIFFRHVGAASANLWIGAIFVLVAIFSATLAIWVWSTRRISLSIESGGRVSYGGRELCAGGAVGVVRIGLD